MNGALGARFKNENSTDQAEVAKVPEEKMEAKIVKIELVNHTMLTFTLEVPVGMTDSDFDFESSIGGILCTTREKNNLVVVNSYHDTTTLKVGDRITTDGDVIESDEAEGEIESTELAGKEHDYRDAFEDKMKF